MSQDLSISHDFLDQDSQVFHALAKKSSTRVDISSIVIISNRKIEYSFLYHIIYSLSDYTERKLKKLSIKD